MNSCLGTCSKCTVPQTEPRWDARPRCFPSSLSRQRERGGPEWAFAPVLEELEFQDISVSTALGHVTDAESDVRFLRDVLSVRTHESGGRLRLSHASSRQASSDSTEVDVVCRWEAVSRLGGMSAA